MLRRISLVALVCVVAACDPNPPADHLYLWVASADTTQPDFLATLDVTEGSERYGQVVNTLPVPGRNNGPHHTDHELTPAGAVVRGSALQSASIDPATRVYSAAVVESLDRIVTTTTDMNGDSPASRQVQIRRLSDFALLHTIVLPDGATGGESMYTAEPRLLADGKTVIVSTFNCSLYLLDVIETNAPSGRLVASFPRKEAENCAIPVVRGHHYVVTVPAYSGVVSAHARYALP